MARSARIVLPGYPHHLILRGNNRRRLVSHPDDHHLLLELMAAARERTECQVHVLCMMTNHLHLVAVPPRQTALSEFVKGFAQRYAWLRNRAHDSTGKLFEERFISIPILSERQLAITTAYIELNPVRAGVVDSPAQYAWSTYGLHTNGPSALPPHLWTPSQWFASLGRDAAERAHEYAAWVDLCETRGEFPEPEDLIEWAERTGAGPLPRRPDSSLAI
jgi:putative transposase